MTAIICIAVGGPTISQKYRINEKIRAPEVLLIDDKGQNRGVIKILDARKLADEAGFDLVEVSPEANPPVCRILNYGKLKYQQKKKDQQKKKIVQQKEIRLRPRIGEHDLQVKMKQIGDFLNRGDKVLVTMNFRGREMVHAELAVALMNKIAIDVESLAKTEKAPKIEGRRMCMMLVPKNAPASSHSDTSTSDYDDSNDDDSDMMDDDEE